MSRFLLLCAAALLAGCSQPSAPPAPAKPRLEHPPDVFRVKFQTNKGDFVVQVTKAWAPHGVERFFDLVQTGFFDGDRFFRVTSRIVQFGINGDPKVSALWRESRILDDPVKQSNTKGRIAFAALQDPNSRTMQVFINTVDNTMLDKSRFAPFGEVVSGMEVVSGIYSGYGDSPPRGNGPVQDMIQLQGNAYLEKSFPRLDYIKKAEIE